MKNISVELGKQARNRQIFKFINTTIQATPLLSPSHLLVTLLAARSPRTSNTILTSLVETIQEICQIDSLAQDPSSGSNQLWFTETVCCSREIRSTDLQTVFSRLFENPFLSPEISTPLLEMSLSILDKKTQTRKHSSWANLSIPALSLSAPIADFCIEESLTTKHYSCYSFAAWIFTNLFEKYPHIRAQIAR